VIEETIDEASQYVEDYLDRSITEKAYTERIVGRRSYTVILDNYPITGLVSVSYERINGEVGTFDTSRFLIHAESGIIEMIDKSDWFREDSLYSIAYTAGYTVVPGPVKRATALQTIQLLRPMYGDAMIELPELVSEELITNLLEKYRRKRIA
jgi:hypothetical protein